MEFGKIFDFKEVRMIRFYVVFKLLGSCFFVVVILL